MRTTTPEVWSACDLAPGDRVVAIYGTIAHRWWDDRFTVHAVHTELSPNGTPITFLENTLRQRRAYSADTPMSVYPGSPK